MDHRLPIRKTPKRHYVFLFVHIILSMITILWFIPTYWEASFGEYISDLEVTSDHAAAHSRYIARHLQDPFDGYEKHQVIAPQFAAVAISHMAAGWMNVHQNDPTQRAAIAPHMEVLVKRALHPKVSPYKKDPREVTTFGDHNLYLSHLNVTLGVYRHITKKSTYDKLHTRVSKHLARKSVAGGDGHARSYPAPKARLTNRPDLNKWPADQTVLLASLYLYDKTRKGSLSKAPITQWLRVMRKYTDETTKLHLPTLDKKSNYAKLSRGCALSWSVLYMSQFAPKEAERLYVAYRKQYAENLFGLGVGGFREWPTGVDRGMDNDSGLIIFGVGAAATGLGLGPARIMKDHGMYTLIERTATVAGLPFVLGKRRQYATSPILGESILFHGKTARRWFGKQIKRDPVESTGVPGACMILLFFACAFLIYNLMGIREKLWAIRNSG